MQYNRFFCLFPGKQRNLSIAVNCAAALCAATLWLFSADAYAQENRAGSSMITDLDPCRNGRCPVIGDRGPTLYKEVHVLTEALMPPRELREDNYFLTIEKALRHVEPSGTIFLHTGEYAESIVIRRPGNLTLTAYEDSAVTIKPPTSCITYAPWFQEPRIEPVITIKNIHFKPAALETPSDRPNNTGACLSIKSGTLKFEGGSIVMPDGHSGVAIRAISSTIELTNAELYGGVGAQIMSGVLVDENSSAKITGGSVIRDFSYGIENYGVLRIEEGTLLASNGSGLYLEDQGPNTGEEPSVIVKDSYIETEAIIWEEDGAVAENDDAATVSYANRRAVVFGPGYSGSTVFDNVDFLGTEQQSDGVIISGYEMGDRDFTRARKTHAPITIQNSFFEGFETAVKAHGSVKLVGNIFGDTPYLKNTTAIDLIAGKRNHSRFEVIDNTFNQNEVSIRIGPNIMGGLTFSGNTGEMRSRRPQTNMVDVNVPNPERTDIFFCEINTASEIDRTLMKRSHLGRVPACER